MDYTSILGIDVASAKLDFCWDDKGKFRYKEIKYTEASLKDFLKKYPQINHKECLVGLESTGDYHVKVAQFFLREGFVVKIINPILTNQKIRTTIRGSKTDKKDSEIIYKLLKEGKGTSLKITELLNEKKELLRLASSLTKFASQMKLRLQSTKRKSLPDTKNIEEQFQKIIQNIETFSKEIIQEQTKDRSIEEEYIDSIPGFAVKLSAVVHHEIGEISRFKNSKSLVAFAGLDPKIKQSGKKQNTYGRITKRGSPHLRTALFLAANVARKYDTDLAEYYEKKKSEGRTYKEIMCMIGRKLLARIYSVLKEKRCYQKR